MKMKVVPESAAWTNNEAAAKTPAASSDDVPVLRGWQSFLETALMTFLSAEEGLNRRFRRVPCSGESQSIIAAANLQVSTAIAFHTKSEVLDCTSSSKSAAQSTSEIRSLHLSVSMSKEEEARRVDVATQLQSAFRRSSPWPKCEVLVFGSSLSKFGSKNSDLDLVFRADSDEGTVSDVLVQASNSFRVIADMAKTASEAITALEFSASRKKLMKDPVLHSRIEALAAHWKAFAAALVCNSGIDLDSDDVPEKENSPKQDATAQSMADLRATAVLANKKEKGVRQKKAHRTAGHLSRYGCVIDHVFGQARVPVIKFSHIASGYACDLSFGNNFACINTMLLRAYAEFDNRSCLLGIAIKHWAKRRGIADASLGFLSSYSFILLVIFFLQQKDILPNLQHPELKRQAGMTPKTVEEVEVSFCTDISSAKAFHFAQLTKQGKQPPPDTLTVGELLAQFFRFYNEEFDHNSLVVSIRHPERQMTKRQRWCKKKAKPWRFSIEDPFEKDRDVGKTLFREGHEHIIREIRRALHLLGADATFEDIVVQASTSILPPQQPAHKPAEAVISPSCPNGFLTNVSAWPALSATASVIVSTEPSTTKDSQGDSMNETKPSWKQMVNREKNSSQPSSSKPTHAGRHAQSSPNRRQIVHENGKA